MESRVLEKNRESSKEEDDFFFLKKENHLWRGNHDSTLGKDIIFLRRGDDFYSERKARVLIVEDIISFGKTLFLTFFFFNLHQLIYKPHLINYCIYITPNANNSPFVACLTLLRLVQPEILIIWLSYRV